MFLSCYFCASEDTLPFSKREAKPERVEYVGSLSVRTVGVIEIAPEVC